MQGQFKKIAPECSGAIFLTDYSQANIFCQTCKWLD